MFKYDEHDKQQIKRLKEMKRQYIESLKLSEEEKLLRFLKIMRGEEDKNVQRNG